MSDQNFYGQHLAVLKRVLSDYQVGEVNWTEEDRFFISKLEQLPFDFQIVQCLKGNEFKEVKGLERSFGHRNLGFSLESFYWNIHPEDIEDVISTDIQLVNWLNNARNGSIKRTLLTAQFRFSDKSGNYHLVNRNSFIIKQDETGRASCLYHFFVDVTETEQFGRVKYRFQHPGKRQKVRRKQCNLGIDLTKRESEILRLIVKGMSSQEISNKLFISKETVYRHRKNMIKKTNSKNTKSLAMRAISENWV
ncbi:MAG: helix-turn-helix transcriptional regulator [Flavobacteriales bacterium]|nr:helix-turn-helix transcriptional regulator [Flavobacteriales bacterium]NNK80090.1 helix-turn-helix transcriptional regulator [Flavobacteriales bacterium]